MPKKVAWDSSAKVTIKIPRNLYNRLQEIIADSGFDSVTDFTVHVLRDLAAAAGGRKDPAVKGGQENSLTGEEVEAVRKRLKNLGYL